MRSAKIDHYLSWYQIPKAQFTSSFFCRLSLSFSRYLSPLFFMSTSKPSTFHLALAVSNIKNHISITFEMENVQYATWAELFKIHSRSYLVINHIIPSAEGTTKAPTTDEEKELWLTLDATVLQWIYTTISNDLLQTILEPDSTAVEAWNRLRGTYSRITKTHVPLLLSRSFLIKAWRISVTPMRIANG